MDQATAEYLRLVTWTSRHFRSLVLEIRDGRSVSAWLPKSHWAPIISAAVRDEPAGLKRLLARSLRGKRQAAGSLPICTETLSLVRLLNITEGLGLPRALRVAAAWTTLPACDRVTGGFNHEPRKVVQAQLLGLVDPPSAVVQAVTPLGFQSFLRAARYAGLASVLDLDWQTAHTPIGRTSMVFAGSNPYQRHACLAISTCEVSYLSMDGNGRMEGLRAVQALLDYVPTVIADDDACRWVRWDPAGHEIMEIVDFLERLKGDLGQ